MSKFERFLEIIVLLLMTALAVVVVVGVGFRKAGAALVWYDELASILLAWLTYYGACLAALRHAHIGFPKLVDEAAPTTRRVLVLTREVVVIGFFVLVAWAGWQVQRVLAGTYLVSMPSIPTGVAHSVIPIGALLFVVAELAALPARLAAAGPAATPEPAGGGEPAAPPGDRGPDDAEPGP